jgi:hypothetical protein
MCGYLWLSGTANVKEWGDVIWRDYGLFYFMCVFACVFDIVLFFLLICCAFVILFYYARFICVTRDHDLDCGVTSLYVSEVRITAD